MLSFGYCYSSRPLSENERKQKDKHIFRSCQRVEKDVEYEGDNDTNSSWYTTNSPQVVEKETGRTGN